MTDQVFVLTFGLFGVGWLGARRDIQISWVAVS